MSLFMTLLVRDEEDLIRENLTFHLAHGVDHVIVTDNLSCDGTPDILDEFVRLGVVTVIREISDNYSQSKWVTRMAAQACERGARWVIHSDADEFWVPTRHRSLRAYFRTSLFSDIVYAPRHDFACVEQTSDPFWQRMVYRKVKSLNPLGKPLPPKVAHRSRRGLVITEGNHDVTGFRKPRKKTTGIEILHFPIRSRDQYIRKIVNGGRAYANNTSLSKGTGITWRAQYAEYLETGTLRYAEDNVLSSSELERAIAAGTLVLDQRLRDFFAKRGRM